MHVVCFPNDRSLLVHLFHLFLRFAFVDHAAPSSALPVSIAPRILTALISDNFEAFSGLLCCFREVRGV